MPKNAPHKASLLTKLESRNAQVAVVGLGYVGLPLAVAFAEAGHSVIGIDRSEARVMAVNAGRSQIEDIDSEDLGRLIDQGRLRASMDYSDVAEADAVVIAVPTPIDEYRVPDLTAVQDASASLAAVMKQGALVVLESTTYPGTTEEIIVEAFRDRGFRPGVDLFVGYSPERIDPGNDVWKVTNTPKVVSGFTKDCLELTVALYGSALEKLVPVSNLKTAEITKLFENIFRIVNIALVNEFQVICDSFGIDVWEVIQACSTKPYGFMPFYPGPGLGGHCVPVDPFYLAWKAREKRVNTEFIELAGRVSSHVPAYVVSKVARVLNVNRKPLNGSRVALLGVAYKKNTADVRESPAVRLVELLHAEGVSVSYHDPHVPTFKANGLVLQSQALVPDYLAGQDCVVIVSDHDMIDWTLVLQYAPMVVDTRNVLGRLSPTMRRPVTESSVPWTEAEA